MPEKDRKIILDTNLWISFLLTHDYSRLDKILQHKHTKLVFSPELIEEFITVSNRPKFRKFFSRKDIEQLLDIFESFGILIQITSKIKLCRDNKDNFLLSLALDSHADYLLTGDKDLLIFKKIGKTQILTIKEFEKFVE